MAKFHSEAERLLAVILVLEYQPDFVAETEDDIYMLEPKQASDMPDTEVIAKRDAAVLWCQRESTFAHNRGENPWSYALIPHDAIMENMSLDGLVKNWAVR